MRECWVLPTVLRPLGVSGSLSCSCDDEGDMCVLDAGEEGESNRLYCSGSKETGDRIDGGVKGDGVGADGVDIEDDCMA